MYLIKTVRGDITKPLGVQAIVNAANSSLLGGGGVPVENTGKEDLTAKEIGVLKKLAAVLKEEYAWRIYMKNYCRILKKL